MKIKEINESDCILCYVSDRPITTTNEEIRYVVGKFQSAILKDEYKYVDYHGYRWKYAIPCEDLSRGGVVLLNSQYYPIPAEKTTKKDNLNLVKTNTIEKNEELDTPPTPKWSDKYPVEWSIDAKIFKALSEGAVLMDEIGGVTFNSWTPFNGWAAMGPKGYKICTFYTGTGSDIWEGIE